MGSRRKRILLIYSIVMLVPGIILGYLAYRGILNDQALREKQARQELESISSEFFSKLDSTLNSFVLDQTRDSGSDNDFMLFQFEQSQEKTKQIKHHNLLYLPKGFSGLKTKIPIYIDWQKGWEYEFSLKDLEQAYSFYEEQSTHNNSSVALHATVAMARTKAKQDQPNRALALYERILQDYQDQCINSLPAHALALFEIYKIQLSNGNNKTSNQTRLELISCLENPKTSYEKSQYSFFAKQIIQSDSLSEVLIKKQLKTDRCIQIFNESEILFNGALTNPYKRYFREDDETLAFISYTQTDGLKTGLVLDLNPFIQHHEEDLLAELNKQENIIWQIEGSLISPVRSNDENTWISFPFPEQLPAWNLKMSVLKPSWISTILALGNGVFLLIFIFIILIMLFGLGFTIHILNQELKLNKLKTEFISNVSHELKSPLTSIRQMTEMLNDKRVETENQRNDYYGIMLDQSEHLSHLIDNILDFSRMEEDRKHYRFEVIDLAPLMKKLVTSFQHQLDERGFELNFNSDSKNVFVNADRDSIIQVVYNLLDNAVKFSGSSKRIEICLEETKNNEQRIKVRDFGLGINKKDVERVFDRFYRSSESQKLAIKGSGIGLTLVQRIVEAHKGRIKLDSEVGEGSTFHIYLPIVKKEANEKDTAG